MTSLRDFYFPALSVAVRYDRAVGFFSASTLSHAAQALSVFIQGGGKIRLIVGAFSEQSDIEAIKEGLHQKEVSDRLGAQFLAQLDEADDELFQQRFKALAWLVGQGRLEVRVALRARGMYHDKVGIITDADGDAVVFAGSANESAAALLPTMNYESIDVFPAWREELAEYHGPHLRRALSVFGRTRAAAQLCWICRRRCAIGCSRSQPAWTIRRTPNARPKLPDGSARQRRRPMPRLGGVALRFQRQSTGSRSRSATTNAKP